MKTDTMYATIASNEISKQIKILNKNGIYPLESKPRLNMLIVKRSDLEKASRLKISNEITIASRI